MSYESIDIKGSCYCWSHNDNDNLNHYAQFGVHLDLIIIDIYNNKYLLCGLYCLLNFRFNK